ncbi:MAG: 3-phosphoshikimate 1-carboxyvinyltransferase [Gammaproteobacteria bacterium]
MSTFLVARHTARLQGQVTLPASKSQSIRALIFALLAEGESRITQLLDSEDTQHAIAVCRQLGAEIHVEGQTTRVKSSGLPLCSQATHINSGNSGITTRFILPLLGLRKDCQLPIVLDCEAQMRARPIDSLVDAVRNLGLSVRYLQSEGRYPIEVQGSLRGGNTTVSGVTSQFLSALLIALPFAANDSEVSVKNLHERPYVDLTLEWLQRQHIGYVRTITGNTDIFKIEGGQRYQAFTTQVAGDFSSASYLIAAACLIGDEIQLKGLNMAEPQGDKRLVMILQQMGADIEILPNSLKIRGGKPLQGMAIDANDIPDLVPTLAVIATQATGKTKIYNVPQARIKETDRLHSMTVGLRQMGAQVAEFPDALEVSASQLTGATVQGFGDHRTVMALALAGLLAQGETRITDGEAIAKTFPTYVECMQRLGAHLAWAS